MTNSKIHKTYNLILKIVIVIGSYLMLYFQLNERQEIGALISMELYRILFEQHSIIFILLLFMMFLNWSMEAFKWKLLINPYEKLDYWKSLKAIFAGLTVSTFTPNRIGEFVGRIYFLRKLHPIRAFLLTLSGSIAQNIVTFVLGTTAAFYFLIYYKSSEAINLTEISFYSILLLGVGLLVLVVFFFFRMPSLSRRLRKLFKNRFRKYLRYLSVIERIRFKDLRVLLLFSFLRYCVFSTQYFMLLRVFDIQIPAFDAFILIALMFFVLTAIPTIALSELGVRGSVAVYLFDLYSRNYLHQEIDISAVVICSALLWVINIVIPSIIGGGFVFQLHFFKPKSNDQ